jgi:hypothetical protein
MNGIRYDVLFKLCSIIMNIQSQGCCFDSRTPHHDGAIDTVYLLCSMYTIKKCRIPLVPFDVRNRTLVQHAPWLVQIKVGLYFMRWLASALT